MPDFRAVSGAGKRALDVVVSCPGEVSLVLDYDGVLAPAPAPGVETLAHPRAGELLIAVAARLAHVAILSARDAQQIVRLVGLQSPQGSAVTVLGQHGLQRWSGEAGRFTAPAAPAAFAEILRELPWGLRDVDRLVDFERRGSTLLVPVLRFRDPVQAAADLQPIVTEIAHRHGLDAELTHEGWEIRPARADKGRALADLVAETRSRVVVYAGDNRADLPVFESVDDLRRRGVAVLLLYAGDESDTLMLKSSDIQCNGPAGVIAWLDALVHRLTA